MISVFVLVGLLIPAAARAQSAEPMPHDHMMMMQPQAPAVAAPTEGGQSAFAAIDEIVTQLEANPKTDWAKVDIEALRQHLIDMNNLTLYAEVKDEPIEGGLRFVVTGAEPVAAAIRRMTLEHAAMMNGAGGWSFAAEPIEGGAAMTVKVPAKDLPKLKALGFIGVMTRGMHHQMHHLMIARGEMGQR